MLAGGDGSDRAWVAVAGTARGTLAGAAVWFYLAAVADAGSRGAKSGKCLDMLRPICLGFKPLQEPDLECPKLWSKAVSERQICSSSELFHLVRVFDNF